MEEGEGEMAERGGWEQGQAEKKRSVAEFKMTVAAGGSNWRPGRGNRAFENKISWRNGVWRT